MEREIREQPGVLATNCGRYFEEAKVAVGGLAPELVVLVARGSSDNAALYARYIFEIHVGIPVVLMAPSVITRYGATPKYPRSLVIGVSQSGAGPDVAEVLSYMREAGHATLGVTNTGGSVMTQVSEQSILLGCGVEGSIAATKTYTASLLCLAQIARALGADLPDPSGSLPTDAHIDAMAEAAQARAGEIVRSEPVFCLGRGYDYSTALETALKLMECALISAKPYSTADFEHGPKALAGHGTACLVYGDAPKWAGSTGTTVVSAPLAEEVAFGPWKNVVFGQWIALLAARARGLDPDKAFNLQKVTMTR